MYIEMIYLVIRNLFLKGLDNEKRIFVCHGNICRSPIAEYVFKYKTKGMDCCCESRALSNEEIGNDIYPGSKKVLDKHHIPYDRHYAKRMTLDDYNDYDEIYIMDSSNEKLINRMFDDVDHKISKLAPFDIEDPWYTGNFDKVFDEISEAIDCIIKTW